MSRKKNPNKTHRLRNIVATRSTCFIIPSTANTNSYAANAYRNVAIFIINIIIIIIDCIISPTHDM